MSCNSNSSSSGLYHYGRSVFSSLFDIDLYQWGTASCTGTLNEYSLASLGLGYVVERGEMIILYLRWYGRINYILW
jgi:hypothetical protein